MSRLALASAALALVACHDRAPVARRAAPPSPEVRAALEEALRGAVAAAERARALDLARRRPPSVDLVGALADDPSAAPAPTDRDVLDSLVGGAVDDLARLPSAAPDDDVAAGSVGPGGLGALAGGSLGGPRGLGGPGGGTALAPEVDVTLQSDPAGLDPDAVDEARDLVTALARLCARSAASAGTLTDRAQATISVTALDRGVQSYVSGDAVLTDCLRAARLPATLPVGTTLTFQLVARAR